MCDTVAAQLVGHEPHGFLSLTLQQSAKESPRCTPVPTGLYEDVDQVTVLIHRAPEILALTVDRHEDFVQEPRISESTLSSLQLPSVVGAELPAPLANGFVGHDDSSFGQQILNIPEAHAVSVVEPDGMADDFGRKAIADGSGAGECSSRHCAGRRVNLTMPIEFGALDTDGVPRGDGLTITVSTTATLSTDATLTNLALEDFNGDPITLNETFASTLLTYTASVTNADTQIDVLPTRSDANATIEYLDGDGVALPDADPDLNNFQVDLDPGDNVIQVKVTAEDTTITKTYMVTVTRAGTTDTPVTIEAEHESIGAGLEDLLFTLTREGATTDALEVTVTITQAQSWLSNLEYTVTFPANNATAELTITASNFSFTPLHHGRPHRHGDGRRHRRRLGHGGGHLDLGTADHDQLRHVRLHLRGERNGRCRLPGGDARCGLSPGAVA